MWTILSNGERFFRLHYSRMRIIKLADDNMRPLCWTNETYRSCPAIIIEMCSVANASQCSCWRATVSSFVLQRSTLDNCGSKLFAVTSRHICAVADKIKGFCPFMLLFAAFFDYKWFRMSLRNDCWWWSWKLSTSLQYYFNTNTDANIHKYIYVGLIVTIVRFIHQLDGSEQEK